MSTLSTRVELRKLADELGVDAGELAAFEEVPAEALQHLRAGLAETLFQRHRHRFVRLAKLSSTVPAAIAARVAEAAMGPMLGARVAAVMEPPVAVKLAGHLPTDFLADLAARLDPVRAEAITRELPDKVVVKVGRRMLDQSAYLALGRFVSTIDPDTALQVMEPASGHALLQIALFSEDRSALDEIVRRLPDEKLAIAVRAAVDEELYDDAVTLVAEVALESRLRLIRLIADLSPGERDGFVRSIVRHDSWDPFLPALGDLPDEVVAAVVNTDATLEPGVLATAEKRIAELGLAGLADRIRAVLDDAHEAALT